jgi:Tfp pilus assembly protein PilO
MAATDRLAGLRNRTMMLLIGGSVLVLLIWYVAYFAPSGKQLGAIGAQTQTAQTEQATLNTELARLRSFSKETGALAALSDRLGDALPATTDIYDYITALSNAGSSADVKIGSIDPGAAAVAGPVSVIPVSITASGTYDQTLAFIKALYALPRLTVISSVDISGGGAATSRSTVLTSTFALFIFALPSATTPTPTSAG